MTIATTTKMPTGTVTFLFTDIEGSTKRWEQFPRAMQAAIALHDALLREAIEQQGGYVFKTVGDAFCAAFPTAPQAVEAALAGQRALRAADWGPVGTIKVRMALHTGVAEVSEGDYHGLPLNRVARLLSAGHGEQILLSLATQQLARDHLPPDTELRDLGEGGLKDLVRAEHVYQVLAPDLPSEFPALKALDTQYVEPTAEGVGIHNPYKGLRAFQETDAAEFFGREALTRRLLERMAESGPLSRFLAVVGPSGSGKSSVVRAGVIPALRQGKLPGMPGSDRWLIVEMLPGAHPLEELDAVLLSITANPVETVMGLLKEGERGLVRAVKRVLPRDESVELVLVIDQFEEVFTLAEDEPTRVRFLDLLCAAVADPRSRVRVVVTLRADFFDRPLLYPDPGELMRQRTNVVLPLSAEELERAIVKPAQRVGVGLEEELVATIIKDVGEQPGALPLLQYAMTELFERRIGKTMTLEAYNASGGVLGALAQRADESYDGLTAEEQEAARQLFLRLITLGEGTEDTRRRVRRAELASISRNSQVLERVIELYGKYRLLTFDMDPVTKGPTVEVAHEALIRTWGKLQGWLDESRSDLRVQRQLMAEATEWEHSGRDASYLATGARLTQFEALAERADRPGGVALTGEEKEYLAASVEEREKQEKLEKERQAKELALARQAATSQRSAASRLRYLLAGAVVFLVVAAILAVWALNQSQVAQSNFTRAEAQRLAAQANTLLAQGGGSSAETIALLSLRSIRSEYSSQGDAALAGASTLSLPAQLFTGHTSALRGVAFSPDGKYVLTASFDKTAKLWDEQIGKQVRTFSGHTAAVYGVAFSPDGKYVLTGSFDKTARLWDVQTGQVVRTFSGHTAAVLGVAFSPDGKYALTSSKDNTAKLWDAATGKEVRTFSGHTDWIIGVAFSPDGKYVLTASHDKTAKLWDAQTGQVVRTYAGHDSGLPTAAFSPDGKSVLTGSYDDTVRIWDAQTGKELHRFTGYPDEVFGVAYSPDGHTILVGGQDTTMRLWDAQTGEELRRFTGFNGTVAFTSFSPDGRYVLASSYDGNARLWDLQAPTGLSQYIGHTSLVNDVAFSPDGKYLVTAGEDNLAIVWDALTGKEVSRFTGHTGVINWAVFSPDGKTVLSGSWDKTATLSDALTGKEVRRFVGHASVVQGVAFSPDGEYVLTGSSDQTAKLWDAQTGKEVRTFSGHTDQVWGVAFSPDGKYVATGSQDNTARLWNSQTGQELQTLTGHTGLVWSVAFSPDGKYALTGSMDKTARLWDVQTGQAVRTFSGHTQGVWNVAFSPDGKYVLTGSSDKTARLWDLQTGQELRRFVGHTAGVYGAAFSPDGKYVATSSADDTARLWYTDYHSTINYLCGKLVRDFTDEERVAYEIKDTQPTCPKP